MAPGNPLDKLRESRSYAEARVLLLRQRGHSLTTVADGLNVDRAYVSRVNSGTQRGKVGRVEKALARALGLSLAEAFPERYGDGERVA